MMKCPFCQYENEDGAVFCDQCKSDLAVTPPPEPVSAAVGTAVSAAVVRPVVAGSPDPATESGTVGRPCHSAGEDVPLAIPVGEVVAEDQRIAVAFPMETPSPVAETEQEPPPTVPFAVVPASSSPPQETPHLDQTVVDESTQVTPAATSDHLPPGAQPKLVVLRGLRINVEYPLYEGPNFIGRMDEQPVDIDLEDQEPPDRIWSSRQHALINYENGELVIEDLKSSNGTFVNRTRLSAGQKRILKVNDIIQIGTVQMKVKI